jgi:phenylpropionate dioxygenase-like ring-hydroxylating dioxygenase large terminal subunit
MIKNQWYPILDSGEVTSRKITGTTRLGEKLIVWRTPDGKISIMADKCIHRGASLSLGAIKGDCVACPFHGFLYDCSGKCTLIPANGKINTVPDQYKIRVYPAMEKHGFIWMWYGEPRTNLPEIPWFENLDDSFHSSGFSQHWASHYSRCIENQLDVVHLPFVHHNTIGRGNKTLVHGPFTSITDNGLFVYYNNVTDDGRTTPQKTGEYKGNEINRPHLQFIFPNIWQNWLTGKLRIMIAFVPIDDSNSRLYIRIYQKILKVPILSGLFSISFILSSKIIANQDRSIVITQHPKITDYQMDENLIGGDYPIVVYRRIRKAMQQST